ncbi:MAG: TonB-dependent receptor [Pseudomonadota bacterium]
MKRYKASTLKMGVSLAALALIAAPGFAQDVDTSADDADDAERRLGVITVTAEKQEESVQDVSLSVQAFDADALRDAGVTDVSRLEFLVSGVNFAFTGNDAKFNVRGANSSNTFSDNTSIVGTFIDGVFKPRASQQTRAFFDIGRVEFLKGPQGTLYGRNTLAGALNVSSNTVDFGGYGAGIEASYERFDRATFEGFVNVPITDTFGVRVAGFYDKSDGYIENLAGDDLGAQDDKGFRITSVWQPTTNFDATLRFSHIEEDGREGGLFGFTLIPRFVNEQGLTDPFGGIVDPFNPQNGSAPPGTSQGFPNALDVNPFTVAQDFTPDADLDEDVVALELNWDLGPVTAKSITSYTDFQNFIGFDFDFSPNPFNIGGFDETAESVTQELVFASDYDSRFQWTGGLYYSQDELFFSFSIFNQTLENNTRIDLPSPDGEGTVSQLVGTPLASLDTNINGFFADSAFIETDTFGVFAQGEFSLLDNLRLIGGLRYSNEDRSLTGGGSNFTGDTNDDGIVDPPVTVLPGVAGSAPFIVPQDSRAVFAINENATDAVTLDETFDNVTWRAGIEYDFNEDVLLYVSSGTGFLSGALGANGTITDEQESLFVEGGVKSQLLNNSLKLNAAVHYTEYTNLLTQVLVQNPETGIVQTFSGNGGSIDAWGIEVESAWVPIENLTLTANLAYLNSEFGTFAQANPFQDFSGPQPVVVAPSSANGGIIDVSGERTPFTPEFTAVLSGSYEFSLGDWGYITPVVQFFYSSDFNTSNNLAIDPAQEQDDFTKTDLRLIWDSPDTKYSVELFVENVEDEATLSRGTSGGDDNIQTSFAYPRNYGVRVRATF